ncbi:MAG TPA: 4-hydroxythreonine-4-phosphate dehydrogenase PdxA [Steroidobacteraceae bacterium]|nr:4-hydroxythreonine-4-phosphate dehydrogenase PdxA [Steroidobacteraceae bacterium]
MAGPRPRLVLTSGEPAGIGPDICLQSALAPAAGVDCEIVCLADATLLAARARQLGLPFPPPDARFRVEHIPLAVPTAAGRPDPRNARYVLALLDRALAGCRRGEFAAMVTAPVQKSVINDAGIAFTGHTEYLAAACGVSHPVMLLAAGNLRVALATTHLPLRAVGDAITGQLLDTILDILQRDLVARFGLARPRIGVCGLNPHAGESGHLGREELEVIGPAIQRARTRGIEASGPWPADTIFTPRQLAHFDVVLAMFHDQGLPVLKHAGFGEAVNVTLGLPVIRTSVDHGTALDLAGTGRADAGSLLAALRLAAEIAARA